VIIMYTNFYRV